MFNAINWYTETLLLAHANADKPTHDHLRLIVGLSGIEPDVYPAMDKDLSNDPVYSTIKDRVSRLGYVFDVPTIALFASLGKGNIGVGLTYAYLAIAYAMKNKKKELSYQDVLFAYGQHLPRENTISFMWDRQKVNGNNAIDIDSYWSM